MPQEGSAAQERRLADTLAAQESPAALPWIADELEIDKDVRKRLRHEFEEYLRVLLADGIDDVDEPALRHDRQYAALRLALIAHKQATVGRLRDQRTIDDTVPHQLRSTLKGCG